MPGRSATHHPSALASASGSTSALAIQHAIASDAHGFPFPLNCRITRLFIQLA
jgi:hypothetical protein